MKAVIPAKTGSARVPNKNWREFHGGKSLVDINIESLMAAGFAPQSIYVSSDSRDNLRSIHDRYGVHVIDRDTRKCNIPEFIRGILSEVPGDDDIAWSQVCDPLFDEHATVMEKWARRRTGIDSITVIHPIKQYLLDQNISPIGWGFHEHHIPSQNLPTMYTFPFTFSILTRECLTRCGYHVGHSPCFHVSNGGCIDIDTEEDFAIAQFLYERKTTQ